MCLLWHSIVNDYCRPTKHVRRNAYLCPCRTCAPFVCHHSYARLRSNVSISCEPSVLLAIKSISSGGHWSRLQIAHQYHWAVTGFCLELVALPPLQLFKRRAIILGTKFILIAVARGFGEGRGEDAPLRRRPPPLPLGKGHTSKKAFTLKQRMHLPTSINQQARLLGWTVKLREKQKWPRSKVRSLLNYLAASWQPGFVPWANVGVGANMLHSFVHVNVHNACFPPFLCMQALVINMRIYIIAFEKWLF